MRPGRLRASEASRPPSRFSAAATWFLRARARPACSPGRTHSTTPPGGSAGGDATPTLRHSSRRDPTRTMLRPHANGWSQSDTQGCACLEELCCGRRLQDSAGWGDQGDVRWRVVGVPIRRSGWPVVDRAEAPADRADNPGFQPAVVDAAIPAAGFAWADVSRDREPEPFPTRARTHRLAARQAILGGVARWETTHRVAYASAAPRGPSRRGSRSGCRRSGRPLSNGSTLCVQHRSAPVSHRSRHQQRHPSGYRPTSHPPGL